MQLSVKDSSTLSKPPHFSAVLTAVPLHVGRVRATCPRIPLAKGSGAYGASLRAILSYGCYPDVLVHSSQPPMLPARRFALIGSNRFQNGSLTLVKNKTTDDSWFFRFYEDVDGKRVHRNLRIGTVREFPRRRDAEKAVLSLRAKINIGIRSPETVNDLVAHYQKEELTLERKAYATVEAHKSYLTLHILPKWGSHKLSEVKTVEFEKWLESLELAPATKTKIRNIMSAVYSHGIRHEWILFNPISKVRCRQSVCVSQMFSHRGSFRCY
jgi:hypothetical protein